MKFKNKHYDALKWIGLVFLPALSVLVGQVGESLTWEHTATAVQMINSIAVFLGALLGLSSYQYNKENK